MAKNNKGLIWVEEILMTAVVAFTVWGAIKGAWIALIITAVAVFMMFRQWRVLKAMNESDEDEEGDYDDDEEVEE